MHRAYKDIQLPQLRSFCLVAGSQSFTAAAKVLALSVPAVWQHVRALEQALGVVLLRRRGSAVQITDEGRLLLELVQPHVAGIDTLGRLFESRRAEMPRRLTVISTHGLTAYHLPAPVQEFTERHPGVQLRLRADIRPAELVRMLEQGEADLALLAYDRDEERSPYLDYRDLYELQLCLLSAPGHPLARKKRVGAAELVQHPLVMEPEGSLPRRVLDRLAVRHNLGGRLHIVAEGATLDVLRRYVARGIGVSLMFLDRAIAGSIDDLHVRAFEPAESVPVALVVRKGGHLPEAAEQFIRIVRRHLPGADAAGLSGR